MGTEAKWSTETITDSRLNAMTHLVGTTSQRTGSTAWPTGMLFWDTDLNQFFRNGGTEGTPISQTISAADTLSVHPVSTTIGDYTTATDAVATSATTSTTNVVDDMETDVGFVEQGTGYLHANGELVCTFQGDNVRNETYIDVQDAQYLNGSNLDDDTFAVRIKFRITTKADGSGTAILIAFSDSASGQSTTDHDFIGFCYDSFSSIADGIGGIDGASIALQIQISDSKENNDLSVDTWYWLEFIRTAATTYTIGVFTDESLSTQIGTTRNCTSASSVNLRYIHFYERIANTTGSLVYQVDELALINASTTTPTGTFQSTTHVRDNQTSMIWKSSNEVAPAVYLNMGSVKDMAAIAIFPHADTTVTEIKIRASIDATFTDAENVRTIKYSKLTEGAYNYIRFNRLAEDRQYIQIIGTDGGSKILALNDVRVLQPSADSWLRKHGHLAISTSDANLSLDGT